MKKILAAFLVALLAACGGGSDDTSGDPGIGSGAPDAPGAPGGAPNGPGAPGAGPGTNPGAGPDADPDDPGAAPPGTPVLDATTRGFLDATQRGGLAMLALAELAVERGENEAVRGIAERIVEHQTWANAQLGELAGSLNVTLPQEPGTEFDEQRQALEELDGAEFDRAWAVQSVGALRDLFARLNEQAETGTHAGIRDFAAAHIPAGQAYLLAAKTLAGALDPQTFLIQSYKNGLVEIALGELAAERSENQQLLSFAEQLVADHRRANTEIAQVAQANNTPLDETLTVELQTVLDALRELEGADFDKAFTNFNVIAHESAVAQARAQAREGEDAAVAALAALLEPDLVEHRDMARALDEEVEGGAAFELQAGGLGDVLLAQLALQRSGSEQVRTFAQRALDEQSEALRELRQVAEENELGLPPQLPAAALREYLRLAQLEGTAFDRAYAEYVLESSERLVERLGQAAQDEATLAEWVAAQETAAAARLERARSLLAGLGDAQ